MKRAVALLAAITLFPAMAGPLSAAQAHVMIPLCGSGASGGGVPAVPEAPPGSGPCCAKGCHGGSTRKRAARTAD